MERIICCFQVTTKIYSDKIYNFRIHHIPSSEFLMICNSLMVLISGFPLNNRVICMGFFFFFFFFVFFFIPLSSVQFSHLVMSDSTTPWTTAHQASLSITNSHSSPKPMPIESVMPSNYLIFCCPLPFLPSIFPSIRIFSNESALCIRSPKDWSFSFSITPCIEYSGLISFKMNWLDLAVQRTLKESSPIPWFKSISSSVLNFLYSPTLTSMHDHWKNHSLD